MKDAQKPDHVSLSTLIRRLREGRFVIPDFQREFEWQPWDIRDLIRSVFLDYYIGSLLLWKGKSENFAALSCEPIYGHTGNGNPEYIVLDGQQRLTALYYACLAPDIRLPNRANRAFFFIRVDSFMAEDYDTAFFYEWESRHWSNVLTNVERQFDAHLFPLEVIGADGWELAGWVMGYEKHWQDKVAEAEATGHVNAAREAMIHVDNAREFGAHLKEITAEYQVSYIELNQDLAIDKVCDIFTQINSKGVRLDSFDLINALLKPKGLQLKHMWRAAEARLQFAETDKMNVYILQVMSILAQAYCSPKYLYYLLPGVDKPIRKADGSRSTETLIHTADEFEGRWNRAVASLESALKILQHPHEFGAISASYLPYVSILPVFAALQAHVKTVDPNRQLDAQRKVRHWYWASVFTNRYSGSVESTSTRDYLDVTAWIDGAASEPSALLEFKHRFRNLELRKEIRRGTSVYNGVFNLLIIQGVRDWMTGTVPLHDELDDHHIVPASWAENLPERNLIHTILNRTPLTPETNRHVINSRLPNEYLPDLIEQNGEQQVRAILESHFISSAALEVLLRDPFTAADFEAFIAERQRTIQHAIESLLIKERLDLSPALRELDDRIEKVELSLRSTVARTLDGDSSQLPQHVIQKAKERIQRATSKNAALDIGVLQDLDGLLEYSDLRELQDTITSKTQWPLFEPRFRNKEMLNTRFSQLGELRNSIRHSRAVDQIVRMDGEVGIAWFEQVLAR